MTDSICADLRATKPPLYAGAARVLAACSIAAVVSAGYVWSNPGTPSPAGWWAAAFLFIAIEEDVRRNRIPNWLTLPGLVLAVALASWTHGWSGLPGSLAGAGLAFALMFPPFLLRWMGAGDAKAVMVLGALFGPAALLGCLWWMLIAGGLLALASAVARGALFDMGRRWSTSLMASLSTGRLVYLAPAPGSAAASGIPFAVAIGLGAASHQIWGVPWA